MQNARTYKLVRPPENYPGKIHKNGHVQEHRLVWWQHTGEVVPDGFDVHHKDGDKRNNCIDNLEILSKSDHIRLHRGSTEIVNLECCFCGKYFKRCSKYRITGSVFCTQQCYGASRRNLNRPNKSTRQQYLDAWKFKVSADDFIRVWDGKKSFRQVEKELGLRGEGKSAKAMAKRLNLI